MCFNNNNNNNNNNNLKTSRALFAFTDQQHLTTKKNKIKFKFVKLITCTWILTIYINNNNIEYL